MNGSGLTSIEKKTTKKKNIKININQIVRIAISQFCFY